MDLGSGAPRALVAIVAAAVLLVAFPPAEGRPQASWAVSGTLLTPGGSPIAGANVTLVVAPCPVLPDPNDLGRCQYVASALSGVDGSFSVPAPAVPARYWLYSHPAGGYGGDYRFVTVTNGPVGGLTLTAWPYRPYGNATIVLPHYDLLSAYACNGQAVSGCGTSFQVPILSWTANGAIYVNASHNLVFYSFSNNTTRVLSSAWTPLYQNFMGYGGIENTEWVTADGSYVYTFGCTSSCGPTSRLELEAVNVSTGALVTHLWNVTANRTAQNGQGDLIGISGSYGYATLIDQGGHLHLFSFANQSEWVGGRLAYFEANNVYWVPELTSYIDVSAGGLSLDKVSQYRFNGSGFQLVFEGSWGSGTASNFVNGLVYNLTAHEIYFEAGTYTGNVLVTDVLHVAPNGTLDRSTPRPAYGNPGWPERKWGQVTPLAPEHRLATTAWGPTVAADYSPLFYNSSWLQDLTSGTWFATNQSMDSGASQADNAPNTVDGLFYNGSYAIDPASLYCTGTGNKNWSAGFCPLGGTFPNTTLGTIWWFWQIGQPRYPFPSDAPLAQTSPPAMPSVEVASIGATSITVNWTRPAGDQAPLLNWTVFWGTEPGNYTNSTSVVPWARSATIAGLESGTRYYFGVVGLNHHWFGPAGTANGVPVGRPRSPLAAPSALSIGSLGAHPTLTWRNPPGTIHNVTVDAGPACSGATVRYNAGGNVTSFVVPSVPNGTTQWFTVTAWDAFGASGRSNCVGNAPGAPDILYASPTNATTLQLLLVENSVPVFRHSVRYGPPSCDAFPFLLETANRTPWVSIGGLNRSETYCFEAASWSYGGESPWGPPLVAATYGTILAPPEAVVAVPNLQGVVVVRWTNPPGPLVNDTLLVGSSCATLGDPISAGGPASSMAVGGLPNGTPTWFAVVAWSPAGSSIRSDCASDAPPHPTIVSAVATGPGSIAIVASDAGEPVYNRTVWYAPGPCGTAGFLESVGSASARIVLDGLLPSTRYCVKLASWSFGGLSPWSAAVLVDTPVGPPPVPLVPRLVRTGLDTVTVSWAPAPSTVANVSLGVGTDCAGAMTWTNESPAVTTATIGGLSAATRYCLQLRYWNGSLASPTSLPIFATTRNAPVPSDTSAGRLAVSPVPIYLLGGALVFLGLVAVGPILRTRRRPPPPRRQDRCGSPRRGGSPAGPGLRVRADQAKGEGRPENTDMGERLRVVP